MAELSAGLRCGRPLLLFTCLFAAVLGKPGAGPAVRASQAGKALGGEPGGGYRSSLGPQPGSGLKGERCCHSAVRRGAGQRVVSRS